MQLIKREVEVEKESNDVGEAVKQIMVEFKKAKADGWQPGQDIPAVLMGSYTKLLEAINGLDLVDDAFKAHPVKAAMGMVIPLSEGVELFISKDESK